MNMDQSNQFMFKIKNGILKRIGGNDDTFELCIRSLTIPRGKAIAIVGASGSGKTSLLNILGGLMAFSSGHTTACVDGLTTFTLDPESYPHRNVGRVFQEGHLLPNATVAANLAIALHARDQKISRKKLIDVLSRVDLGPEFLDQRVWQLSGGQEQRVAIARAMAGDPDLIIADEPTSSLDPALADLLMQYLKTWVVDGEGNKSLLWVTHHHQQVIDFADEVLVLTSTLTGRDSLTTVINEEPELRASPDSVAVLRGWVAGSSLAGDAAKQAAISEESCGNTGWKRLSRGIALSDIFSNAQAVPYFKYLSGWVSLSSKSKVSLKSIWAGIRSFREYGLLVRQILASLLILSVYIGYTVQTNQTESIIENPKNCHISISGSPRTDHSLHHGNVDLLSSRPWLLGLGEQPQLLESPNDLDIAAQRKLFNRLSAAQVDAGCNADIGAWPRRDENIFIGYLDQNGGCDDAQFQEEAKALIVHRNEPVLEALPLVVFDQNTQEVSESSNVGDALRGGNNAGRDLEIVLSRNFVVTALNTTVEKINENDYICIQIGTSKETSVRLRGVSNVLPADSRYFYDAVLPLEAFERVFQDRTGSEYITTSLYFNGWELSNIQEYLIPDLLVDDQIGTRFRLDPDLLDRLRETLDAHRILVALFLTVAGLTIIATFAGLVANYTAYMAKNARAFAMQLALGIRPSFLLSVLFWHMFTVWVIATISFTFIAILFYHFSGLVIFEQSSAISVDSNEYLVSLTFVALIVFVTSAFAISCALWVWLRGARLRLAEILQAGS